ncbi:MAG: peptidylprolyl isomerase [Pseudomonadota bacterium]
MPRQGFFSLVAALVVLALGATSGQAQGQFSPELQIGTTIVTRYQIDQRTQFLTLLGATGDIRELARQQLISETLQLQAAREEGIEPDTDAIQTGIAEFAARANLTPEQFLDITRSRGISQATIRDFFTAGVAWRATVRERFGDEIRGTVTPDDARRALVATGSEGGLRVLISEILLPASTPETQRASQARAAELSQVRGEAAFAAAARQFSVAPSARNGGEVNWVALDSLPPEIRSTVAALRPGQVSRPVSLENAIGLFFLRNEEEVPAGTLDALSIDYALFTVNGGQDAAAEIISQIDVCNDLYPLAQGLPEDRLVRDIAQARNLPSDIRAAVDTLDENETALLNRGGTTTILMLCQRLPGTENTADIEIAGNRLLNARLGTAATHFLAQLRAEAQIVDFTAN